MKSGTLRGFNIQHFTEIREEAEFLQSTHPLAYKNLTLFEFEYQRILQENPPLTAGLVGTLLLNTGTHKITRAITRDEIRSFVRENRSL